jgi:hypothetical protein
LGIHVKGRDSMHMDIAEVDRRMEEWRGKIVFYEMLV